MRKGLLLAGFLGAALLLTAGSKPVHAETQNDSPKPTTNVVVSPGDSLTIIAQAHETTFVRLYAANEKITNPDLIYPGDSLRVPAADEQLPDRPLPAPAAPVVVQAPVQRAVPVQPKAVIRPQVAPVTTTGGSVWDQLALCESGGNWAINTGNGFYGGLQFTLSSWRGVGGSGYPNEASREEQISRGEMLRARQGWGAWPACSSKLGLR